MRRATRDTKFTPESNTTGIRERSTPSPFAQDRDISCTRLLRVLFSESPFCPFFFFNC